MIGQGLPVLWWRDAPPPERRRADSPRVNSGVGSVELFFDSDPWVPSGWGWYVVSQEVVNKTVRGRFSAPTACSVAACDDCYRLAHPLIGSREHRLMRVYKAMPSSSELVPAGLGSVTCERSPETFGYDFSNGVESDRGARRRSGTRDFNVEHAPGGISRSGG